MLNDGKLAKKGLTRVGGDAIISHVAASDGAKHRSGRDTILENDTEKVILYKKC